MSEYLDVLQFHKNETSGKWRRTTLGYARQNKDGTGWDLYLDALPMPGPNGCRISILPRQERQQQGVADRTSTTSISVSASRGGDLDDEIPF